MSAQETLWHFDLILEYDPQIALDAAQSQIIHLFEDKKVEDKVIAPLSLVVHDREALDLAKEIYTQAAKDTSQPKPRILVLNLASDYVPGGGWRKGSLAQEESLFYRSTYDLSLNRRHRYCSIRYPLAANQRYLLRECLFSKMSTTKSWTGKTASRSISLLWLLFGDPN